MSSLSILILPDEGKGRAVVDATVIVVCVASINAERVVGVPTLTLVDAVTVTGPAIVPLLSITVAFPLTVEPVATSPMYSPPLGPFMMKLTAVPSATGFPLMSFTRNFTTELAGWPELLIPMTCGEADTKDILPVDAGITVTAAVLLTVPAVAVIVTVPGELLPVNVVVAVPLLFAVVVVALERAPYVGELRAKLTAVPSRTAFPLLSLTVAVMVVVPSTVIDDGFTEILKLAGGGAVIVTVAVAVKVPVVVAVAVTVTDVGETPDVKTTCATPLAPVIELEVARVAAVLLRLKVTVFPDSGRPAPSIKVAVMVVVLFVVMDVELAESVILPIPVA